MNLIHVGTFPLGGIYVDLLLDREKEGAAFSFRSEKTKRPSITVGIKDQTWTGLLVCLLHEVEEMLLCNVDLRFKSCGTAPGDTSDCLFVMDHTQFSRMIAWTGDFLAAAEPKFKKAWIKAKRKP